MIEGNLLSNPSNADMNEISFPDISGKVLEIAIQYMYFRVKWAKSLKPPPEFHIPPSLLVEVLLAANYLGL